MCLQRPPLFPTQRAFALLRIPWLATKPELGNSNHLPGHIKTEQRHSWRDGRTDPEIRTLPLGMIEDDRNCSERFASRRRSRSFLSKRGLTMDYKYIHLQIGNGWREQLALYRRFRRSESGAGASRGRQTVATKCATKSVRELRKVRKHWQNGGPTRI